MANTSSIQFKRSSVEGTFPSTANLSIGELALNLTDKKGFTKDTNTIITIFDYKLSNDSYYIAISAYDQANTKFNSSGGTISGDVIVTGNITVQGTTTTVNSDIVTIKDANIVIANVSSPTDITANNGGLTVLGTTNKYWNWLNTSNSWTSSEHIDIAQGKSYKINRITVLSDTTLGSGILYSSLTSVGTLTNLVANGNVKSNTALKFLLFLLLVLINIQLI